MQGSDWDSGIIEIFLEQRIQGVDWDGFRCKTVAEEQVSLFPVVLSQCTKVEKLGKIQQKRPASESEWCTTIRGAPHFGFLEKDGNLSQPHPEISG